MAVQKVKVVNKEGAAGYIGFLTWLGALIYFVNQVDGFWNIILAFLKACVWPAIFIYQVFTKIGL